MKLEIFNLKFRNEITPLVKSFLPDVEVEVFEDSGNAQAYVDITFEGEEKTKLHENNTLVVEDNYDIVMFPLMDKLKTPLEQKNYVKKRVYLLLKRFTGKDLPWGTLTGVRPTKLVTKLLYDDLKSLTKKGHNLNFKCDLKDKEEIFKAREDAVRKYLKRAYLISNEKIDLAIQVSKEEHSLLRVVDYKDGYSLYVNIPFCPTRCAYCSFTAYPISAYKNKVEAYLDALEMELEVISEEMGETKLQTIYIGGGTPTTLEADELDRLLSLIEVYFDFDDVLEITVEAGRPDSITREKLEVIKEHGVDRISINPQTMNQKTLDIIGRRHTVEDIKKAFNMAREVGISNINMDIILGLPEETIEDVKHTIEEIKKLEPESFTVHSLAIKRAAKLTTMKEVYKNYSFNNSDDVMKIATDAAYDMNMIPYYMYRQKNMKGNLENIGFSKKGKACLYNILIMEEKQTIMAAGAGASTKIVNPKTLEVTRKHNPKDVGQYLDRIM